MNSRYKTSRNIPRGACYPEGNADMDMTVLDLQLETTRVNWLQQRQQRLQVQLQQNNCLVIQNNSTHESVTLPELVGLFDNHSSADDDVFCWQGEPQILDNDDINFKDIFHEIDEAYYPAGCPKEVKETAATENEVVLLDDDSDDDVVMFDNPRSIPVINNFSMFGNGNPEFTAEESCNEKGRNVEAESVRKRRGKAKPSPYASNDDPLIQELECIREEAKRPNRNPERQSLAEKIEKRTVRKKVQCLQEMIPGCKPDSNKSFSDVVTEAIVHLKYLQNRNQLLAEEANRQNPTPESNVNMTPQLLTEAAASRQNTTPENNVNVTPKLLAEAAASRQNRTPEYNVNVTQQLLPEAAAGRQNCTPGYNVIVAPQLLAEAASSSQNSTPERNVNITPQLLVEEAGPQNPTPKNNVGIIPASEGNQNLAANASASRRKGGKANKSAVKKKKSLGGGRSHPAPAGSVAARNANFAYLTQQARAMFAAPQIARGGASTSTNWSIPQQYTCVPAYYPQKHPMFDIETLSLLYQSCLFR